MTKNPGHDAVPGRPTPYFFLSYAHSDPLAGGPGPDPGPQDADHLVSRFFADLTEAVRVNASPRPDFLAGFCDRDIPRGTDWKRILSRFLGSAQVFVPLYSPGYLTKSWPGRELACFRRRAELAGQPNPVRRLVPVLWTPLLGAPDPPGLREALDLVGADPDYAVHGLRMLLKVRSFHRSYQAVVNLLAKQIVTLAESAPIEPSEVPVIDEFTSEFLPTPRLSVFTIQTVAPSEATAMPDHGGRGYGTDSTQWKPFAGQELPLAEYAKQIAERFDFEARVTGIEQVPGKRRRRPGIMLIDPWFIADEAGRAKLAAALRQLPHWVLPLVVLSAPDDERTSALAAQVHDMLVGAGAVPTDTARQAARGIRSLDAFYAIMQTLVPEAERQYFQHSGGGALSRELPKRTVQSYLSRSDETDEAPDSSGETPDAG